MEEKLSPAEKIKVLNADDLYGVMQKILLRESRIDRNKEHFWTVGLDVKNRILYIELISLGGADKTVVEPMQVFRVGVLKGAGKMILVHNHPSQELAPSEADKDLTDRLLQVGRIIQIEVIDHLIISEKTYLSFLETGLLEQLRKSKKYQPDYQLKAGLKKEVEELVAKEATEKRNKEIALQMKQEGYKAETIAKLTGLSEKQVKGLKAKG